MKRSLVRGIVALAACAPLGCAAILGLEERDSVDASAMTDAVTSSEAAVVDAAIEAGDAQTYCATVEAGVLCEDFEQGSPASRGWSVVAEEWQDAWVPVNDGGLLVDRGRLEVRLPLDSLRLRRRGILRSRNAMAAGRLEFDATVLSAMGSVTLAQISWGIADVVVVEAVGDLGKQMTVTLRYFSFGRGTEVKTLNTQMKFGVPYHFVLTVTEKVGSAVFVLQAKEGAESASLVLLEAPAWRFDGGGAANEYFTGIAELDRANNRSGQIEIDNVTLQ